MKCLLVVGARPNFMKIAPLYSALQKQRRRRPNLQLLLVHTGQHYSPNMSDAFFRDLGIPEPDVNLNVGSGGHGEQTGRILAEFEALCLREKPDWVIVVGDVNSTLACALAAKKLGISVAHVEAGLRSGDMSMPEEINRLCTDAICDLLFTTDEIADANLRREGVSDDRIHFVGNTMIDTLLRFVDRARSLPLEEGLEPRGYAVLTLHRPASVDDAETLRRIIGAVNEIADHVPVVFPVHPRTIPKLESVRLSPGIRLRPPLSYLPFLGLMANARMALTDSGGIQEETTVLGVPCLTMRTSTERPITCQIGSNLLVGLDPDRIVQAALRVLTTHGRSSARPPKWDGRAAERIAAILLDERRDSAMPYGVHGDARAEARVR